MAKFYAIYEYAPMEVAIFETKRERDDWVNYKDQFSIWFPPLDMERMKITRRFALQWVGSKLDDRSNYIKDDFLDNVMWVIS